MASAGDARRALAQERLRKARGMDGKAQGNGLRVKGLGEGSFGTFPSGCQPGALPFRRRTGFRAAGGSEEMEAVPGSHEKVAP